MNSRLIMCLVFLSSLFGACGHMNITLHDEELSSAEGKKPKKGQHLADKNTVEMSFFGTSDGIAKLVEASNRRKDSVIDGEIAKASIEKGMPVSRGTSKRGTNVQAGGYGYGLYGGYGAHGLYGNTYGSPQLYAAEAATFGAMPGYLPPLSQGVVQGVQPQGLPVLGEDTGNVQCPMDRKAVSEAERIACLEVTQKLILKSQD